MWVSSPGVAIGNPTTLHQPPAMIYRAALEAIGFGFAGLAHQAQLAGARPSRFVATGGATNNRLLMRIISACLGAPIAVKRTEAGLLGLAFTGIGTHPDFLHATGSMITNTEMVEASASEQDAYAAILETIPPPAGVAPGDRVSRGANRPMDRDAPSSRSESG